MSGTSAPPVQVRSGRRATRTGLSGSVQRAVDLAVPCVLVLLALLPLWPVYRSGHAIAAALIGVTLGAAIALAGALRRWNAIVMAAVTLGALIVTAAVTAPTTAIAGVLPTIETWRTLGIAVVRVWKQVLTLQPPLGNADGLLTVVYLLALVGAVVAGTIALRARALRPLALVVPAVVLVGSVLLGTSAAVTPAVVAGLGVLAGLGWPAWRSGRIELNRPVGTVALGAAALVGVVGGTVLGSPDSTRFVLRDHVDPPPLEENYPSPLAGFRDYVKNHEDDVILTLDGVPTDLTRVRLATLDSYGGQVWDVSDGDTPAGGRYLRATDRFVQEIDAAAVDIDVTIGTYDDVWLPMTGSVEDVTFEGDRATDLSRSVFYNEQTATAIVTDRLREGDTFTLTTLPTPVRMGDQLGGQVLSDVSLPPVNRPPDGLGAVAARLTEGATTDAAKVQALADGLSQTGFFSHGLEGDVPSEAGHGAARMALMVEDEEMIGDAEQYAALMTLMAREMGWPARVVYGFERGERDTGTTWAVTGGNVTAWVEVAFEGEGWVAYDPTPDENNVPISEDPAPADRPQPQMLQPPPPPIAAPDVPSLESGNADVQPQEDPEPEPEIPAVVRWAAYLGIPVLLLILPAVIALALKGRRRRRRRRRGDGAARVAGGWLELQDTARDLGLARVPTATRREQAGAIERHFADAAASGAEAVGTAGTGGSAVALATRADAAVFGPVPADEDEAERFWGEVTGTERGLRRHASPWRRLRARIGYASLRRRD
ncbi:transglutaminase-like domain-containing protein [Serinibacter arcticus]|uniref:Putative cysteine protease n=1 Tax=Serinibacter arcticus TaxID=1655435 RepID=A0A4Z1DXX5_9MICO|nr:transglutaminase-like domain-containing protein [Serinibacter arcticus]TGO04386.1 putative cysteine protease [Serinibacter arcticus]